MIQQIMEDTQLETVKLGIGLAKSLSFVFIQECVCECHKRKVMACMKCNVPYHNIPMPPPPSDPNVFFPGKQKS